MLERKSPQKASLFLGDHVILCTQCGASLQEAHRFCWKCGAKAETSVASPAQIAPRSVGFATQPQPQPYASPARFVRLFGLDPRIALLTLIVDMMLNGGDLVTMGLLLPVSIAAGIVLGYIAYKAQINWYGDDKESARIKAVALGLLTAIPTPLPELLYIPAGLLGLWRSFRRRESKHLNTHA
jgi:hypothetical protein